MVCVHVVTISIVKRLKSSLHGLCPCSDDFNRQTTEVVTTWPDFNRQTTEVVTTWFLLLFTSQRNIPVLLGGVGVALVAQHLQRVDQARTGFLRLDHLVPVTAVG